MVEHQPVGECVGIDRLRRRSGLLQISGRGVFLRHSGDRWIVDEVDERGQRHDETASFSTFSLAEKFLIWNWASLARSVIDVPQLGADLYAQGFSPEVQVHQLSDGIYRLTSVFGDAVVMGVPATIFSHLMSKSVDEIERMVRRDLV